MTQFLTNNYCLLSTPLTKNSVYTFQNAFSGKLCFLTYIPTHITFLADTGSVPNLIRHEDAQAHWPAEYSQPLPLDIPVKGIGGNQVLNSMVSLPFGQRKIPFCMGESLSYNIIGIGYLAFFLLLCDEFFISHQRPSDLLSSITVLEGKELITPFLADSLRPFCNTSILPQSLSVPKEQLRAPHVLPAIIEAEEGAALRLPPGNPTDDRGAETTSKNSAEKTEWNIEGKNAYLVEDSLSIETKRNLLRALKARVEKIRRKASEPPLSLTSTLKKTPSFLVWSGIHSMNHSIRN